MVAYWCWLQLRDPYWYPHQAAGSPTSVYARGSVVGANVVLLDNDMLRQTTGERNAHGVFRQGQESRAFADALAIGGRPGCLLPEPDLDGEAVGCPIVCHPDEVGLVARGRTIPDGSRHDDLLVVGIPLNPSLLREVRRVARSISLEGYINHFSFGPAWRGNDRGASRDGHRERHPPSVEELTAGGRHYRIKRRENPL